MTRRPEAYASPPASDRRYRMVFEQSREGICLTTAGGQFLDVNPAMLDLLGYTRRELLGMRLQDLCAEAHDRERVDEAFQHDAPRTVRLRLGMKDGTARSCLLAIEAEHGVEGTLIGFHGLILPAREPDDTREGSRHATLHDRLTQLPNRTFFLHRVERLLERRRHRSEYHFGVLVVDLDRFKLINDSLGRRAGDELLVLIAERLSSLVRPEDIVARFGGDEFAVLAMDLPGVLEAELIARRVHDGLREAFDVLGHEVYVSASVGISLSRGSYAVADEMIRDADTAMHAAKEDTGVGWAIFDEAMHARTVDRFATEMALRRAVERSEFVLHYQPLVALESRSIMGFEALLRWDHPERGLLLPDGFLAVAEETGLIVPIGHWVLAEACRTAAEWRAMLPSEEPPLVMAVNLSVRQLVVPGLAEQVRQVLEEAGLPGEVLRLEITETVFLETSPLVRQTLAELHGLGVNLCLDDFGTGYSSLGYLRDLPVNLLKIDRGFVSRLSDLPGAGVADMIETVLSLAARLEVMAVAEGVETEAQLEFLVGLGCGHAQGFLFSRPVDGDRARELLLKDRQGVPWASS